MKPLTDYYNLNGRKVLHVEDGTNANKFVLTTSNKQSDAINEMSKGNVFALPTKGVVQKMNESYDRMEATGNEHKFIIG